MPVVMLEPVTSATVRVPMYTGAVIYVGMRIGLAKAAPVVAESGGGVGPVRARKTKAYGSAAVALAVHLLPARDAERCTGDELLELWWREGAAPRCGQ